MLRRCAELKVLMDEMQRVLLDCDYLAHEMDTLYVPFISITSEQGHSPNGYRLAKINEVDRHKQMKQTLDSLNSNMFILQFQPPNAV